jgi:hypothetical protein
VEARVKVKLKLKLMLLIACMAAEIAYGPAYAAEVPATKQEIVKSFVGKTAWFSYGGHATYSADGSYLYYDRSSGASRGKYTINDGSICVNFYTGHSRCDSIHKDGNDFILINNKGEKYPIILN